MAVGRSDFSDSGLLAPEEPRMGADREALVEAAHALSRLRLVGAFGHVSERETESMVITPASALGTVSTRDLVEVPLDASALPARTPAEAWVHLAIYRQWPLVRCVARGQPASAFAAAAVRSRLEPLYGQAAWLGASVPVSDSAHLLRTQERASAAAARLGQGYALLLRGNGAITTGVNAGVAVARMWLLAALCDAWLRIPVGSEARTLNPEEIDSWQAVSDELLPRLWTHLREETAVAAGNDRS